MLIAYLLQLPIPYIDIVKEQIEDCLVSNEVYSDCFIIHFLPKGNVRALPAWLPTLLQSTHTSKENGPICCQVFVDRGHVVQFEVVDMGLNEIDWAYFFHMNLFRIWCMT